MHTLFTPDYVTDTVFPEGYSCIHFSVDKLFILLSHCGIYKKLLDPSLFLGIHLQPWFRSQQSIDNMFVKVYVFMGITVGGGSLILNGRHLITAFMCLQP